MSKVIRYQLEGQQTALGCPPRFCRSECTALKSRCSGFGICKSVKIKVIHNYYLKNSNIFVENKMSVILSGMIGKCKEQFGKAFRTIK